MGPVNYIYLENDDLFSVRDRLFVQRVKIQGSPAAQINGIRQVYVAIDRQFNTTDIFFTVHA